MTIQEKRIESLHRAVSGQSMANYTAIVEGCFARFYAGGGSRKRLVMVQRFHSNADAVRESANYIELMGG